MSFPVVLTVTARNHVLHAMHWYEDQQAGLGDRFEAELGRALLAISERSGSFPVIHRQMRKASLHRFPYGVFFVVEPPHIVVLGVVDLRRHPRTWRRLGNR